MTYLLDTDWAINALKGRETTTRTLSSLLDRRLFVSRISFAELYDGAFSTVYPEAALGTVRYFLSAYRTLEVTDATVERFAETRAHLRRRGELIGDFDLLIAATALEHDLTLLTFNRRHFERVPGLRIYQPA